MQKFSIRKKKRRVLCKIPQGIYLSVIEQIIFRETPGTNLLWLLVIAAKNRELKRYH